MSAEIAEARPVETVMLQGSEAARLADGVRRVLHASRDVLSGGRQLDAEDLEALKKAATRVLTVSWEIDLAPHEDVVDLAAERARRR